MTFPRRHKLTTALGIAGVLACTNASAEVTWNFSAGANGLSSGTSISDSYNFTYGGVTANVSGWANTGSSGDGGYTRLAQEEVKTWSGLGVDRPGEGSPEHAVDNSGPDEFILFSFSEAISLNKVSLGWANTDSDITVLAYTSAGTPDLTGNTYEYQDVAGGSSVGLANDGWQFVGHYSNVYTNPGSEATVNGQGYSSAYWLVGALNTKVDSINWSNHNDFVKITALSGDTAPPPTQVPEPLTLGLFGLGLLLLGRSPRQRRAVIAA